MQHVAKRFGKAGERVVALVAGLARQRRAVVESEARFRDFARASADWFWETDAEGRFTWISPQVEERIGYVPEWYLGRRRIDVVAKGFDLGAEPWKSHLETLARREPYRDLVYPRQTSKGMKWVRSAGVPRFDDAQMFLGYRGSATDITAAVEADRRAGDAEERLRGALESLNELIVLTDADDRIVLANRGFRELNAAVAEQLAPGRPYEDHLHAGIGLALFPDAIGHEETWIAERMALRRDPGEAVERRRQDGKWLLVRDQRLPDGGTITVGLDITERKQAEQALRERGERLSKLFRNSPAAIALVRFADGVLLDINDAYEGMFGWRRDEVIGRNVEALRVWVDPAERTLFRERIAAERRVLGYASKARRCNGEVFDSLLSAEIIEEHGERLLMVIALDISERTRAERMARVEHAVTRCVAAATTARSGIEQAMQVLCKAEGWDLAEYWACDESAGMMRTIAHWVSPHWPAAGAFVERSRETVFRRGEGLPGAAWQSAESLWVEDLQREPRMLRKDLARDAGMRGALLVPVIALGRVVGVLMFVSRELRAPDAQLQEAIAAIGHQIGQLVQRRRAEDALREQTERLRIGQSVARMIVMDWDIRKDEIQWSDSPLWLRGSVPADTGKYPPYRDQIHPEDRERYLAECARAIETLEGATREYRIVRTDGEVLWVLSQQAVFAGDDGKAARMLVALHDITERKRAEALAALEHQLTRTLAEADDATTALQAVMRAICQVEGWECGRFFEQDAKTEVLRFAAGWGVNDPAIARFIEWSRALVRRGGEGLIGIAWRSGEPVWSSHVNADPRTSDATKLNELGIHGTFAFPLKGEDRTLGVLTFSSRAMREPDAGLKELLGSIGRQIGLFIERKRAEESALLAAERIRMAAQAARMFSWMWDIETDTLTWTDSPEQLLGPRPDSGTYPDFRDLVHPQDREAYVAMTRQVMASGAEYEREFRIVRTDGEVRWLRGRGKTLLDARERPVRMVGITLDVTERKHAEEALHASEARLKALVTTALDAIIVTDAGQRIVIFNRAAEAIFGQRAKDAIGMSLDRLIPERYRAAHRAHIEGFATSGTTNRRMSEKAKVAALRADGSEFLAEASIMQFSAGGERFFTVMLRDVTEQERIDRELREHSVALERANAELAASHALLHGVLESTGDAILAHDASGRVVAWNRRLVDLSELSEELLRAGDLEAVLKTTLPRLEDPDRFRSEFERIRGDPGYAGTRELSLKDGRVFERHTQPIDACGKPSGRVWSYRDITARVRSQREHEADRQFLQTVLDALPTLVAVTDRAHRKVRVNRAMADILGRRPEELIGAIIGATYAEQAAEPDEMVRAVAREAQVLASGEALGPYEVRRRDVSGVMRYLRVRKLPLKDDAGNITNLLTVGDDITELRNAEEQLRRLNDELEQRVEARTVELQTALRELESFSYSVSHDLRAPARAVAGFSRIVIDDYAAQLPEEGRRLLARISKAGEAMGAMVDGLLELARISRGELLRRPVDLVPLAAEVWRDLAALEPARKVELHVDAELSAEGDPVLLRNLLLNLLGNARKYTRQRTDAAVWFGRTPEGEYFVRDNGVGFDMHYAGKLFGAFQRLHAEREFEGHGIGLALAKKIVERHGGQIRAEAMPGKGATFYFTLDGSRYPA